MSETRETRLPLSDRIAARRKIVFSSNVVVSSLNPDIITRPSMAGAPSRFVRWRPGQEAALFRSVDSEKSYVIQCHPTGSGKTLIYMMEMIMSGGRGVAVTATKGLQDQLMREFAEIGLVDIRGKQNYPCIALNPGGEFSHLVNPRPSGYSCDDGPCHFGMKCSLRDNGCVHYDKLRLAQQRPIVTTNYAMWLAQSQMSPELRFDNDVQILTLDEAHNSTEELCNYLKIELSNEEIRWITKNIPLSLWAELSSTPDRVEETAISSWVSTAKEAVLLLRAAMDQSYVQSRNSRLNLNQSRHIRSLLRKFQKLSQMRGEWVVSSTPQYSNGSMQSNHSSKRNQRGEQTGISFNPVWPRADADRLLFRSIPKIILSSATVRLKTAALLGLRSDMVEIFESPSTFPAGRRPVFHIPSIQMNYRNEDDERMLQWLIRKVDLIIQARQDRKGIIHTVSYKRARYVVTMSRFRDLMLTHDSRDARLAIETFKSLSSGNTKKLLVSPSVSTGYDFPFEECEYQIILKIPFPDTRDPVMKRRCKEDDEYSAYVAIQEMVQMVGRGMRDEKDQCETFILDDNISWFLPKWNRSGFVPRWFMDAYHPVQTIPRPLPKLQPRSRSKISI